MWLKLGELKISRVVRWSFIVPVIASLLVAEWLFFNVFYSEEIKLQDCFNNPSGCDLHTVTAFYKKHRKNPDFYRKDPWEAYELALLLNQLNQQHKAVKILKNLVHHNPKNIRLHFEIAAFYHQLKEYDASQGLFLTLLPHVDGNLQWTPKAQRSIKGQESPLQTMRSVGGVPLAYKVHHYLGLIAYEKKQYHDASFHLERGLLAEPDDIGLLRLTAFVWKQRQNYERAAELLRHAVELNERSAQVKMELVHVLMKGEDYPEAEILLAEVLNAQYDYEPAFQALLSVFLVQGRYDDAIRLMEPWVVRHPDRWELKHRLARLYSWAGRHDDSVKIYEKLLER